MLLLTAGFLLGAAPRLKEKAYLLIFGRADALGLGKPGLYYKALVAGQCVFFICLCYTYRSISYLDRRKIKVRYPVRLL